VRVKSNGAVYLVGAGPGDAGLLTLRGAELLRRADVVLYDALVNPALLRLARPDVEFISRGHNMTMPQEEITALLIARARAGKCVVRLKGGDPYIFGRGGEEAEALAAAKIHFEVVPGVSSIVAAPELRGHSAHAPRALLQLHGLHRPQRFGGRGHGAALRANRQNPRHQGRADGHGKSRRLDKIAHRSRDAAGDAGSRHSMGNAR
jgi:hypothetical protein